MNLSMILKSLFVFGLILFAFQARAQTTIEHDGASVYYLDKVYKPHEPIEPYSATLTLSFDSKTNNYSATVTPDKGEPYTIDFTKPTRKEKCSSFIGNGKKTGTGIKLSVSGLDCKIKYPKITIRKDKKEITFMLTDQGNSQAVSELKKL